MKNSKISNLLNGLIILGILLTLISLLGAPLIITAFFKTMGLLETYSKLPLIISICMYICAIPYVLSLVKLKSICKLLVSENAFSLKIAQHFKSIAHYAFIEVILFIVVESILFFGFNFFAYGFTIIPLFIVPFISITAGLVALIMSHVFELAAQIKEEVDLTF